MLWPRDIIIHPDQILVTGTMQYAKHRHKWQIINRTPSFPHLYGKRRAHFHINVLLVLQQTVNITHLDHLTVSNIQLVANVQLTHL